MRGRRGKSARIAEDTSYRREQEETVSEAVVAAVNEDATQNIETADQASEPKKLDEEVAALMVAGFGGVITKLTQDQADYINVPQEGPFKEESYKY